MWCVRMSGSRKEQSHSTWSYQTGFLGAHVCILPWKIGDGELCPLEGAGWGIAQTRKPRAWSGIVRHPVWLEHRTLGRSWSVVGAEDKAYKTQVQTLLKILRSLGLPHGRQRTAWPELSLITFLRTDGKGQELETREEACCKNLNRRRQKPQIGH